MLLRIGHTFNVLELILLSPKASAPKRFFPLAAKHKRVMVLMVLMVLMGPLEKLTGAVYLVVVRRQREDGQLDRIVR
ncbi:hypothetical protein [Endozoicomonas sp. ALD040]|uniref:hypothetical protein n=1 Tax=Endozoicomonas sp. ALD040 TaxID=3403079 RepID=UPI003BB0EF16